MKPISLARRTRQAVCTAVAAAIVVAAPPRTTAQEAARLTLTTGRSTVLTVDFDVKRIAIANPSVAEATMVDPREILIDGKSPGTVSLIVWGLGRRVQYQVVVEPGISPLQQQLQGLFPGEEIRVGVTDEAVLLSGRVSSMTTAMRIVEIAEKTSSKSQVINMLEVPGGGDRQQVMLQVRFAEVNHRALLELGASLFVGPTPHRHFIGRTTTDQFSAPGFDELQNAGTGGLGGKLTLTDFLNLFIFNTKNDIGAVIRALKARGFFQSLAEPTLTAYNGQEASFLAGGEIPVPIAQGTTGAVSVFYKEFGVRLTFRPTIAGDMIRLRVRPEVSALDFSNGITLQGFRIPALSTRRAETEVELRDGQSFAIGGLLNNLAQDDRQKVPFLGDVPILGAFFRSRVDRTERTEMLVLITARLVQPLAPGDVPPLPIAPGEFLQPGELTPRPASLDREAPPEGQP